eukprot:COSAG01_NODE_6043_length_3882_cov_3.851042_9_plen_88_part_00
MHSPQVIPEFFEYKMDEVSEEVRVKAQLRVRQRLKSLPNMKFNIRGKVRQFDISQLTENRILQRRTGADLWQLMRPRIKLLLTMRRA